MKILKLLGDQKHNKKYLKKIFVVIFFLLTFEKEKYIFFVLGFLVNPYFGGNDSFHCDIFYLTNFGLDSGNCIVIAVIFIK